MSDSAICRQLRTSRISINLQVSPVEDGANGPCFRIVAIMDTSIWGIPVLSFVFAGAGAYLGSYLKRKGENLATKEDFDELLRQLKLTTEATEQIKAQWSAQKHVGESELDYRKAQLSQFYGPIYANLKTSKELYDVWVGGTLRQINKEMIDFFRKQNEEIIRIITTQAHLIDDDNIPELFTHFMTAATIWDFFTARSDKPWVDPDVAALPQAKWPSEFPEYIFSKTQELKKRLDELHKRYSIG
jgi:hypothetical protein